MSPLESGDRAAFLGRLRRRLASGVPVNPAHPLPAPLAAGVPFVVSSMLDEDDLVGSFIANATAVKVTVHDVADDCVPDSLVADIVARHGVGRAVLSREPQAQEVGRQLVALGVTTSQVDTVASAAADLGVTSAVAAIATTGTVVQHSGAAGGRTASLLPAVHLCVLPASRFVGTSAEVLRSLGTAELPSNLALITGPSRSADIEQIIALGVHGPVAVEVVVLRGC